ncbi:MAG: caspase family protein [bacterium]|nr:caspase family protein [bacterium]
MQKFQRNLAIVIGINEYAHGIPPLRTAVNDAQNSSLFP